MPDGRAFRCGLLADQVEMASLVMTDGELRRIRPYGGEVKYASEAAACDSCPVKDGRRACIYDKVSSLVPAQVSFG